MLRSQSISLLVIEEDGNQVLQLLQVIIDRSSTAFLETEQNISQTWLETRKLQNRLLHLKICLKTLWRSPLHSFHNPTVRDKRDQTDVEVLKAAKWHWRVCRGLHSAGGILGMLQEGMSTRLSWGKNAPKLWSVCNRNIENLPPEFQTAEMRPHSKGSAKARCCQPAS